MPVPEKKEYYYLLDITPYSLNLYRNAHHFKLHKVKKDYGENITWQLLAQKAKKVTTPVSITFRFSWRTRAKHDLDNYTPKFILDALTPANPSKQYGVGIIPDDSTEFIKEIILQAGDKKKDCVEMIIREV